MRTERWGLYACIALMTLSLAGQALAADRGLPPPDFHPFPTDDAIGADFRGSDVVLLFRYLAQASDRAQRDEFETTAEHEARTSNLATALAPIEPNREYAFPLDDIRARYDADRQEWILTSLLGNDCARIERSAILYSCRSLAIRQDLPDRVAHNAFGASVDIEVREVTDLRFAVPGNWLARSELFKRTMLGNYGFDLRVPMPIENARALRAYPLKAYAVGKFISPSIIQDTIYDRATISFPTERKTLSLIASFAPERVVIVAEGRPGIVHQFQVGSFDAQD